MSRAVFALIVGGCFAPDPTTGAPCASGAPEGERCPSGQICVMHDGVETCETTDISDLDDRDNDLIPDVLDNCPEIANTDQTDEDNDRTGDACDPCPPFAGVDDVDGDGVGDACDPNPSVPGDKLIAFAGFAAPLASPWTTSGTFVATAGEGFAMAGDNASAIASIPSPSAARVEIRTQARLIGITAIAPNLGAINVVDRFLPSDDRGVACQLSALPNGDEQQLRIFDLDQKVVVNTAPHPVAQGSEIELRLRRTSNQYTCRTTSPVLELAGSVAFAPQAPRIGLRVRGATATFHWVMVVTSP